MSASPFSKIDLSKLPAPEVLVELSYDDILEELTAKFKTDNPDIAASLDFESEPISALNQAWCLREHQLRAYWNALFKQTFLAYASGSSLDQHAALIPLTRHDGETDDAFKLRIQLAPEAFSTAGPAGAYVFHAKAASSDVLDVYVPEATEETAGHVNVFVLTTDSADVDTVIATIEAALTDDIRPLNDFVTVSPADRPEYEIEAVLNMSDGPDKSVVIAAAEASAQAYVESRLKFGKPIYRTALAAAFVVSGVENVDLITPAQDIIVAANAVARLTSISVTAAENE